MNEVTKSTVSVTIGATVPTMQYGNLQYSVTVTGEDPGVLIEQARQAIGDSVAGMVADAALQITDAPFDEVWARLSQSYAPLRWLRASFPDYPIKAQIKTRILSHDEDERDEKVSDHVPS